MPLSFCPGHEFLGKVTEVGASVTKFKIGDHVGVGCYVDSCDECSSCAEGDIPYCEKGNVLSLNSDKKYKRVGGNKNERTMGGYSSTYVVHETFAFKIPDALDLSKAAPILCGGITVYDPLRHWGATEEGRKMTIGVVGIGGLGTMGIKLSKALGHTVVAISTSPNKEALAKEKGADFFVASADKDSIMACAGKCDLILNTVSANHDLNVYLPLLGKNGTIVQLGLAFTPHPISQFMLMRGRKSISGSIVGSLKAHEEVLELCAKHNIHPDCEIIEANKIDWAWEQLTGPGGNKDGIRYVIDVKKSLANESFMPPKE